MKIDKLHSPQRRRERKVDAEIEFSANLCVSAVKPIFSHLLLGEQAYEGPEFIAKCFHKKQ
jgi:hypothetical protein